MTWHFSRDTPMNVSGLNFTVSPIKDAVCMAIFHDHDSELADGRKYHSFAINIMQILMTPSAKSAAFKGAMVPEERAALPLLL